MSTQEHACAVVRGVVLGTGEVTGLEWPFPPYPARRGNRQSPRKDGAFSAPDASRLPWLEPVGLSAALRSLLHVRACPASFRLSFPQTPCPCLLPPCTPPCALRPCPTPRPPAGRCSNLILGGVTGPDQFLKSGLWGAGLGREVTERRRGVSRSLGRSLRGAAALRAPNTGAFTEGLYLGRQGRTPLTWSVTGAISPHTLLCRRLSRVLSRVASAPAPALLIHPRTPRV